MSILLETHDLSLGRWVWLTSIDSLPSRRRPVLYSGESSNVRSCGKVSGGLSKLTCFLLLFHVFFYIIINIRIGLYVF